MSLVWIGRFFSLWKNGDAALPGLRVGGLEMWPGRSDECEGQRPDFLLYREVFARMRRRTDADVLLSIVDHAAVSKIREVFDPLEMLALPLEWSDSNFESLAPSEFRQRKASSFCLGSPRGDISAALAAIWREYHDVYPILAMGAEVESLVERWGSRNEVGGDARDVLLSRYNGLLYIGCPFELYAAGEGVFAPLTSVLTELEEELDVAGWLGRAAAEAVSSDMGTYYWLGDPAAQRESRLTPLRDLLEAEST